MKITLGDTQSGPAGTATELDITLVATDPPDVSATLATWFLHFPGQSPMWDDYLLSIIHLRPIEGVRPAVVRVPHATHEVLLVALDPLMRPVPDDAETWCFLRPVNVTEQVELPTDDDARELLRLAARAVVRGVLPAEPWLSGAVEPWRTALIKGAAHARGEEHAP